MLQLVQEEAIGAPPRGPTGSVKQNLGCWGRMKAERKRKEEEERREEEEGKEAEERPPKIC